MSPTLAIKAVMTLTTFFLQPLLLQVKVQVKCYTVKLMESLINNDIPVITAAG